MLGSLNTTFISIYFTETYYFKTKKDIIYHKYFHLRRLNGLPERAICLCYKCNSLYLLVTQGETNVAELTALIHYKRDHYKRVLLYIWNFKVLFTIYYYFIYSERVSVVHFFIKRSLVIKVNDN